MDYDVVILGGGPGGAAAGLTLARLGHCTLLVDRGGIGAGIRPIDSIENLPGWPESPSGARLADILAEQVSRSGLAVKQEDVRGVWGGAAGKTVETERAQYTCAAVVAALGVRPGKLGVPNEERFSGRGVYTCVYCDWPTVENKITGVVGGGEAACKAALFLAERAAKVFIIHQSAGLAPSKQALVARQPRIAVLHQTAVSACIGRDALTGVEITTRTGSRETLALDGLFVYIGGRPDLSVFREHIRCDRRGRIITGPDGSTSVKGLYAVGAVRSAPASQVIGALNDGVQTGLAVDSYLTRRPTRP